MVGLAEVRGRARHAARRRDRRHDSHLPLDVPRRGRGQGRLGDPQGAQAARAWPRPDRLPDLRQAAVRHGQRRRRGRASPGSLRGPDRGIGARLRCERHRRGTPCRLRHHRRERHGDDLLEGRASEEGPHRAARRRALQGDRPLLRRRQGPAARRGGRRRGARVARGERGRHADDPGAGRRDGGRRGRGGRRGARGDAGAADRRSPSSARRGRLAGRGPALRRN